MNKLNWRKKEPRNPTTKTVRFKRSTAIIFILAIIFLSLFLFWNLFISQGAINGDSMEPTLHNGDRVLIFQLEHVDRFDVVAFTPPDHDDQQYVKRVIGIPGDTVSYENDVMRINDEIIKEDYIKHSDSFNVYWNFTLWDIFAQTAQLSDQRWPDTIPEDMYLVLGDNRDNSQDSRTFGLISSEDIIGVVHFRYGPRAEWGIIH